MRNAVLMVFRISIFCRTFALDKSRAKMLTLGRAQTSLALLSLNRIIAAETFAIVKLYVKWVDLW